MTSVRRGGGVSRGGGGLYLVLENIQRILVVQVMKIMFMNLHRGNLRMFKLRILFWKNGRIYKRKNSKYAYRSPLTKPKSTKVL